jgi:uncharacterized SAM-binding protein YcdF (DUF218 family)
VFFPLSKLLLFIFSPIFWVLLLLAGAWATRRPRRRNWLLALSIGVALVFTNSPLAEATLGAWEMPPRKASTLQVHDVGILLTGLGDGRQRPLTLRANTGPAMSRVAAALDLYQAGHIKRILVSGGSGDLGGQGRVSEARHLAQLLEAAGVPPAHILIEERSRNTRENALFTKQLLTNYPQLQSLVLVTSAYHQRRALGCFRRVGLRPVPFPTDFRATTSTHCFQDWILPNMGALKRWHLLLRETAGYLIYRVLGYC